MVQLCRKLEKIILPKVVAIKSLINNSRGAGKGYKVFSSATTANLSSNR